MLSRWRWWTTALLTSMFIGCFSDPRPEDKFVPCEQGEENCECFANGTCLGDLVCSDGLCIGTDTGTGSGPGDGSPGDGAPGDGDGDGNCQVGYELCGSDCVNLADDNNHCGSCDNACVVTQDGATELGTCNASMCGPTLSDCESVSMMSCTDICLIYGQTCVADCGGHASIGYGSSADCEGFMSDGTVADACDMPVGGGSPFGRCCCTQ